LDAARGPAPPDEQLGGTQREAALRAVRGERDRWRVGHRHRLHPLVVLGIGYRDDAPARGTAAAPGQLRSGLLGSRLRRRYQRRPLATAEDEVVPAHLAEPTRPGTAARGADLAAGGLGRRGHRRRYRRRYRWLARHRCTALVAVVRRYRVMPLRTL